MKYQHHVQNLYHTTKKIFQKMTAKRRYDEAREKIRHAE